VAPLALGKFVKKEKPDDTARQPADYTAIQQPVVKRETNIGDFSLVEWGGRKFALCSHCFNYKQGNHVGRVHRVHVAPAIMILKWR
jgi:hypothetical protein